MSIDAANVMHRGSESFSAKALETCIKYWEDRPGFEPAAFVKDNFVDDRNRAGYRPLLDREQLARPPEPE